jgi:hypothetical protein
MVPQWFKTPLGRSYGAAAALTVCGNPSPPQGIVGTLVTNTLPQFNRFCGTAGSGAADILGFRAGGPAGKGIETCRQHLAVTRNVDGLQPGGVAGGDLKRGFRYAQHFGEERNRCGVGLALVGRGGNAEAQHRRSVVAAFDALDAVGAGIGRDAQMERQPAGSDAPGAQ